MSSCFCNIYNYTAYSAIKQPYYKITHTHTHTVIRNHVTRQSLPLNDATGPFFFRQNIIVFSLNGTRAPRKTCAIYYIRQNSPRVPQYIHVTHTQLIYIGGRTFFPRITYSYVQHNTSVASKIQYKLFLEGCK